MALPSAEIPNNIHSSPNASHSIISIPPLNITNALDFWTLNGKKVQQPKPLYLVNVAENPGFNPAIVSIAHANRSLKSTTRQGAEFWHPTVGANERGIEAPWKGPENESRNKWRSLCDRGSSVYRMCALQDGEEEERPRLIFGLLKLSGDWTLATKPYQHFILLTPMVYPGDPQFAEPLVIPSINLPARPELPPEYGTLFYPSLTNPDLPSSFDFKREGVHMKPLPLPVIAGMRKSLVRTKAYTSVYSMMHNFGALHDLADVGREVSFVVTILKAVTKPDKDDIPKLVVPRADCAMQIHGIPVVWLEEDSIGRIWEDFHLGALLMWKLALAFQQLTQGQHEFLFVAIWANKWNSATLPWDSCLQVFYISADGNLTQMRHDYGSAPIEYAQMLVDLHSLMENQIRLAQHIRKPVWTRLSEELKQLDSALKTAHAKRYPVSRKPVSNPQLRSGDDDDEGGGSRPDNKRRRTTSNGSRDHTRQSANNAPEEGRRVGGSIKENLSGTTMTDLFLQLDALKRPLHTNEVFFVRPQPESEPVLVAKIASPLEIEITKRLQVVPQGVVRVIPQPEVSSFPNIESRPRRNLLVMWYEGCTLTEYLDLCAAPDAFLPDPIDIARALIFGLLKVHESNVAHCDVKPDNVCVSAHPGREATLIDFGLSHILDGRRDGYFDHVNLSKAFGTDGWMAPEVVARESTSLIAADLWSLGATLTHMCNSLVQRSIVDEQSVQNILDAVKGLLHPNPSERSDLRSVYLALTQSDMPSTILPPSRSTFGPLLTPRRSENTHDFTLC